MAVTGPPVPRQLPVLVGAQGGYDYVAEALFNDLGVDGLLPRVRRRALGRLRAAALRPARQLRRPRPGDDQARRAREQGRPQAPHRAGRPFVDVDQLCLSGQCGFSSTVEGNALTHDEQWAKLGLIVETAREVWG
jgi:5-methyltetrahydropteroyltriglutamate--homocysteine methyltransferase